MNTQTNSNTYMVFSSQGTTADTQKASEAVVEQSGALALYNIIDGGKRLLIRAYAPGAWKTVSMSPHE